MCFGLGYVRELRPLALCRPDSSISHPRLPRDSLTPYWFYARRNSPSKFKILGFLRTPILSPDSFPRILLSSTGVLKAPSWRRDHVDAEWAYPFLLIWSRTDSGMYVCENGNRWIVVCLYWSVVRTCVLIPMLPPTFSVSLGPHSLPPRFVVAPHV